MTKITRLISKFLKKLDHDQETFNEERKHKDILRNQESILKYLKPGKQVPQKGTKAVSFKI